MLPRVAVNKDTVTMEDRDRLDADANTMMSVYDFYAVVFVPRRAVLSSLRAGIAYFPVFASFLLLVFLKLLRAVYQRIRKLFFFLPFAGNTVKADRVITLAVFSC